VNPGDQQQCQANRRELWVAIDQLRDRQTEIRIELAKLVARWSMLVAAPGVILVVWKLVEFIGR
jgi:hypothetical protein